jgi:proteasome lid subunit RPN8/RPN11
MSPGIGITQGVAAEILDHARADAPLESCGLLSGPSHAAGRVRATRYHPARNALASATAFDLHPEDLVRIVQEIDARGDELVGVVHSHPRGPAIPSATDVRQAHYPVAYVVVSLVAPGASPIEALRAWRIGTDGAREVGLAIRSG